MAKVHGLGAAEAIAQGSALIVGTFLKRDAAGVWVSFAGSPASGVACEVLEGVRVPSSTEERRRVLVVLPSGAEPPIVVGLIEAKRQRKHEPMPDASRPDVVVDGERLRIEARQELVLRCGDSEVILRRDGKVVVKGLDVTTRAAGTNRIKGADVKIN